MRTFFVSIFSAIIFISILSPINVQAITIIDNTGTGSPGTITSFGAPDTATYGQTLLNLSGPDTVLDNFSMFLSDRVSGSGTLNLRGYVAEWDGSKASNILFESTTRTMNAAGTLQEFAFNTGGLALTPANDYVFFLSISNLAAQTISKFAMPSDLNDSINGSFVFLNNGTSFGNLTTATWSIFPTQDTFLKAEFSPVVSVVPLPAALPLYGSGLAIMGFIGWHRRRKNQSA